MHNQMPSFDILMLLLYAMFLLLHFGNFPKYYNLFYLVMILEVLPSHLVICIDRLISEQILLFSGFISFLNLGQCLVIATLYNPYNHLVTFSMLPSIKMWLLLIVINVFFVTQRLSAGLLFIQFFILIMQQVCI